MLVEWEPVACDMTNVSIRSGGWQKVSYPYLHKEYNLCMLRPGYDTFCHRLYIYIISRVGT